ncbi:prepilin-type N-terminal cleavage/methylation domain-containing protein [candidate division WOR-3 bacterium]|nr:prepilin-type N-terminal cleavage/methylation domain-containing protein [candidate division WOR-3 bacterium]
MLTVKKPWQIMSKGFTLIELLITIVIISIVLLPVIIVLTRGTQSGRMISTREKALFVAQQEMEKMLSKKGVALSDTIYQIREGSSFFFVKRKIENKEGLINIIIVVYRDTTDIPLARLKCYKNEK